MMQQSELVERVARYNPNFNETLLKKAYAYAMHQHRHQKRANGAPYFSHPLEVAAIVIDLQLDQDSVVAALLHDTIEDTETTKKEIDCIFGTNIGLLVHGLTKLRRLDLVSKKTRQGENLRRLLIAIASDVRVLLIKLADRLHNMRTLHYMLPEKRKRIAEETMEIYAPLAGRMGMQEIREDLEDLAFQTLHAEAYSTIHHKLSLLIQKSKKFIIEIEEKMVKSLLIANIQSVVKSRSKRPYSVFRKMERNGVSFEQLSDIIGFRVIVDEVQHCYQTLCVAHTKWPAVPGRFKDYISTPKQNDYRSLHTTIIGPYHQRVELQIRTHEMDKIAEYGIAAHALYKDGIYSATDTDNDSSDTHLIGQSRSYHWLHRTVKTLFDGEHPDDIFEHTRLELFLDQVFCFTPKGKLIALPRGATVIDFAYAVHTDIGNSCVGCKVNGQHAPIVSRLQNGDEVIIIRSRNQLPSSAWENVVATGKARAGIRRATKEARIQQYLGLGTKILIATFKRINHEFEPDQLEAVLEKVAYKTVNDAIAAVGCGELQPKDVIKAIFPDYQKERVPINKIRTNESWFNLNLMFKIPGRRRSFKFLETAHNHQLTGKIPIRGANENMTVKFNPEGGAVPGDRIVGILTPGEGVTVYPIQANALKAFEQTAHEWLDLRWDIDPDNHEKFPSKIRVVAIDGPGILADISEVIAKEESNISTLCLKSPNWGLTSMDIGLEVWDMKHLNRIIREVRGLSAVSHVTRLNG